MKDKEDKKNKSSVRKWLIISSGIGLVLLGIIGLVLPILQGIIFIVMGVSVLAGEIKMVDDLVKKMKRKVKIWKEKYTGF